MAVALPDVLLKSPQHACCVKVLHCEPNGDLPCDGRSGRTSRNLSEAIGIELVSPSTGNGRFTDRVFSLPT